MRPGRYRMDQLSLWAMECQIERGTKETLSADEYKEITLPFDHCYTAEITHDPVGYVAVSEPSTSLTDLPNIYCQSPSFEPLNKRRKALRN